MSIRAYVPSAAKLYARRKKLKVEPATLSCVQVPMSSGGTVPPPCAGVFEGIVGVVTGSDGGGGRVSGLDVGLSVWTGGTVTAAVRPGPDPQPDKITEATRIGPTKSRPLPPGPNIALRVYSPSPASSVSITVEPHAHEPRSASR